MTEICTHCLKKKNFHTSEERILCLEQTIDKLLEALLDGEFLDTVTNELLHNYKINITPNMNYKYKVNLH